MHEISLCQSALEIIERYARENRARRVTAVWLEIGALSCIEADALSFSFDIVCRDTLAEGCRLHISTIPARAWCWDCSSAISVERHDAGCPNCGSRNLRVDGGDDMQIKQIEIE
ncbi:hydrogenase maturation nickel metallochaperone HypA [Enterobacillus tribolii]|uniref:Hydrogenase maturation factor HypA n=1 Tax=Enterobacillus tribolii TaxID=1487935 RepID=A0A370Q8F8_9GAMM|nr:hydrogenase maturation nickel metallochaperone HypA [Enterobacillus tribolii]MBW7984632.1 hydrogenase maturation nickel metallochaperone HypA [Enterobacillus tribolii]RDK84623.1 hydrogenase-1 and 2 nickel incorporation protein HybF [Enterobacillus tribolii]